MAGQKNAFRNTLKQPAKSATPTKTIPAQRKPKSKPLKRKGTR